MTVSIKNLEQYDVYGWKWDVIIDGETGTYRTNKNGEGVWEKQGNEFKQIIGNTQFDLPRTKNSARSKLYRVCKDWII